VLDSGGNLPSGGVVWFPTGQTFKVVFAPSTDTDPPVSPYWTKDNLAGINDVSVTAQSEWVAGPTPTYISATSFSLVGDQTANFTVSRRIKTTNTGGTVYSTIVGSAFTTLTTVTVVNDSGSLDSGLSSVFYGILDPANPSIAPAEINRKGTAVASAGNGTTDIWGSVGDYIHITGTNTIWHFSTAPYAGAMKELIFDASLVINTSAAISGTGGNVSTKANDTAMVRADTVSTAVITRYSQAASGIASSAVFAGPASGASSSPSFRALTAKDGAYAVLLATSTAVNVSSVDFSNITSAYTDYEIRMSNYIPTSTASGLLLRASINSGSTFDASSTVYSGVSRTYYSDGSASTVSGLNTGMQIGSSGDYAIGPLQNGFAVIRISNPLSSTQDKMAQIAATYRNASGGYVADSRCSWRYTSTSPMNAVRIIPSSGLISTGVFKIYGINDA